MTVNPGPPELRPHDATVPGAARAVPVNPGPPADTLREAEGAPGGAAEHHHRHRLSFRGVRHGEPAGPGAAPGPPPGSGGDRSR
ncbi:hypothetical protein KNE206_60110 [Kitasatospora sp. NE20-6]